MAKTPPKKKKHPGGRPTLFRPEFCRQATAHCLLGCTNEQLADLLGVSLPCIEKWLQTKPEFLRAVKKGREDADNNISKSLYKRALGYSHPDVHISNYLGNVTITRIRKHYPPDTAAAIIWLGNRRPDLWRARPEPKDGDQGEQATPVKIVREVIDGRKVSDEQATG